MYANALALAFALAPTTPTDRAPPFDVSDVEVQQTDSSAHVTAYDAEGEVAAELAVWVDSGGRKHTDANFPDGLYLSVAIDGESVTVDSDTRQEDRIRTPRCTRVHAGQHVLRGEVVTLLSIHRLSGVRRIVAFSKGCPTFAKRRIA